jgi:hypothetical protein
MALDLLHAKNISDVDNPSSETELFAARWYNTVKNGLLRKFNWGFAKTRKTILRVGTPDFGFSDEYKLPNDCIKFLGIDDYIEIPGSKSYEIEGDLLLMDNSGATSINIFYIKEPESLIFYDPLFVNLLVSQLAEKMAYKLTMDKDLVTRINQLSAQEELKAVSIFSQERPPKKVQVSKFAMQRRGCYIPMERI